MTPYNFVSEAAYFSIMEAVKTRTEFKHRIMVGKVSVDYCSSNAGCDFHDGETMRGDYIILENYDKRYGDWRGFGRALTMTEFLTCAKSYAEFIKRIDKLIKKLDVDKYESLEAITESGGVKVSQLALFV
ncbi:MAG: hypothetical protein LBB56_07695 [Chitinispirillales bacterium]|jgi:hypothetical protein|nr:hypothetical protein [Chitinispirillales bacterium]